MVRAALAIASLASFSLLSGCLAFDNGCPDGVWGSSAVEGTTEQIGERTWQATGVTLCGFRFSVRDGEGILRLEEIDEDARGPLTWGDLRFKVAEEGIEMHISGETIAMEPRVKQTVREAFQPDLKVGDEIAFCRTPDAKDPHVHVALSQVRYTAPIYDDDGAEANFEAMPLCG